MPARYAGFLEAVRETLRTERYAYRTEQTYLDWVRRFLIFASPKSRREIEAVHARQYLEYLTLVRRVSAGTQNQALNALQFLFAKVLKQKMGTLDDLVARSSESTPADGLVADRGAGVAGRHGGDGAFDGGLDVWSRIAGNRVRAPADQGCRFRKRVSGGAGRKGG